MIVFVWLKSKFLYDMLWIKRICLQLCAGLKHMHSLEPPYAHNDVKPGNVLLTHRKGQSPLAILMDFGSARPARKEIRSRSEALQLQVLGLLTFFFSFSEWCSFSSCFSSTVNVLSVWANSHCYPQGILDKLNMQFTTWSICCFYVLFWFFLCFLVLGMGLWALLSSLQSSRVMGLPKPWRYWWKNWYLVTGMHFIRNNVSFHVFS